MAVTILEALQNADFNINNEHLAMALIPLIRDQLHNATVLLEKGYDLYEEVEPILDKYASVEDVPHKY